MSISYSGIVNYGKITLPSVDSGLGSMNILRDPPRSIHTRRIDKVGQTSSITEQIDGSGDRACEAISLYARGVNPSVSVDYGNAGNNGGQRSGGFGNVGNSGNSLNSGMAFLPYRIARDGAFRPPIVTPTQLLPLSRMPRTNTSALTNKCFIDYTKKSMCPGGNYRAINDKSLKACVRPTATYRLDAPLVEPFEVKYVIKNPTRFHNRAGKTGMRTLDITNLDVLEPTKEINSDRRYAENVNTNIGSRDTVRFSDNSHKDTTRYLQNTLHSNVRSKPSRSIQITPIEDIFDVDIQTKDIMNISHTPLKTGYTKEEHIHDDLELNRRVLTSNMKTNKQQNIYIRSQHEHQQEQKRNRPIAHAIANRGTIDRQSSTEFNNREYNLKPTISAGGMSGRGRMPSKLRNENVNLGNSQQHEMNQKINKMHDGRFR